MDMLHTFICTETQMQATQFSMVSSENLETLSPASFLFGYFYGIAHVYMDSVDCQSSCNDTQIQERICRKPKNTTYPIYFKSSHKSYITVPLKFHKLKLSIITILSSKRLLHGQLKFGILLPQNKRKMDIREYQAL